MTKQDMLELLEKVEDDTEILIIKNSERGPFAFRVRFSRVV